MLNTAPMASRRGKDVLQPIAPNVAASAARTTTTTSEKRRATASSSKQKVKTKSTDGIKRSRSTECELAEEEEEGRVSHAPPPPPPFPARAGQTRRAKLEIALDTLPDYTQASGLPSEVDLGSRKEMFVQEREYAPDADYFSRQPHVKAKMRAVLVDWMFEVGQEYGLKRESVYFGINFVDRYLSKTVVERNVLQLIGVTALWMGSKMEEIMPPPITDFALATDNCFTVDQIVLLEREMAQCFAWTLMPCTAYSFASTFLQQLIVNRCCNGSTVALDKLWMAASVVPAVQLNRVMELLDLAMLNADALCFLPSVLAATAILSLILRDPASSFTPHDVELATNIPVSDLADCVEWFAYVLELAPGSSGTPRRHATAAALPVQELHSIQRRNMNALALHRAQEHKCGFKRCAAAQRSWNKLRPRLRYGLASSSTAPPNEDDAELVRINNNRRRSWISSLLPSSSLAGVERAYSPMTDLALGLAKADVDQA